MSALGRDLVDTLYYGDNLEILSRFISDETVDLVYLDPPFNKNAAYSAIFQDESGRNSDAQMATLDDSWHWGPTPAQHYEYLTNSTQHNGSVPPSVSALIGALHSAIRPSPLLAYLVEMATRMVHLHRVLKSTGSMYLHCDPVASHHLKLLADAVFGPDGFRNEIIWRRTSAHGNASRRYGSVHDIILFYTKGKTWTWNQQFEPYSTAYSDSRFCYTDPDGRRYRTVDLRNPSYRPTLVYEYKGYRPHPNGWLISLETMERMDREGRLAFPKKGTSGRLRRKLYLDESQGVPVTDIWSDIEPINSQARERLGYPTQKPLALLERIIASSSAPGDVVLDPFCGCGTAIEASTNLGRQWIGIDISNLAVDVIETRMARRGVSLDVFDWPTEMDGVRRMAHGLEGGHRFEVWALTRLGLAENKRGGDGGIDGRMTFTTPTGRPQTIIVSVKSNRVGPKEIRELKGTISEERAVMGLIFTLDDPTEAARQEAVQAGFYRSPVDGQQYPRIVIHTARTLIEDGRMPDLPTRLGMQSRMWPIPASRRSVRLRPIPAQRVPVAAVTPSTDAAESVRDEYASRETSPEVPRSLRTSKRDPIAPLPSPGSGDTD